MGLIPDFLSCGRYFMLGEAYFMSGTECNWHCRWKALHSDKCLLLLMNKARICELWGCFEGIACSEMCDFVLCSSFFPFIGFNCWSLPFPAVHEPCNLPWSHPGLRSSLECCRGRQPQPKVLSRSLAPSSLFQAQGTWDIALGSRQSSPCVSGREGGRTLARLCLLSCSTQCHLSHASQGRSLAACPMLQGCLSCLLQGCLSFLSLDL